MTNHIAEVFCGAARRENRRRYGSRRVQKALLEEGIELGRHRIRRLMEEQNWQAIQRQRPSVPKFCSPHDRFRSWLAALSQFVD